MGGKKSPQIHHHHNSDKEPLERNRKLKNSGKLPTYPSPNSKFLTKREVSIKDELGEGLETVHLPLPQTNFSKSEKLVLRISSCSVEVKDTHWKWNVSELKIWATYRQLSYYYSRNEPTFSTFLQLLWPCLQFHPSQSDQLPQTQLPEARFRLLFPRAR